MAVGEIESAHASSDARIASGLKVPLTAAGIVRAIAILTAIIAGLGIAREVAAVLLGSTSDDFGWKILSLDYESNLPTAYSALLLLTVAGLCYFTSRAARQNEPGNARAWFWLAVGFVILMADETLQLHEATKVPLRRMREWTGIFMFPWVVIAIPLVAIVGAAFIPFLRRVHRPTAVRLIVAGSVYLFGAVVMEMAAGPVVEAYGVGIFSVICFVIEEVCEMFGAVLAIRAMLLHLAETSGPVVVSLSTGPASS